MQQGDEAAQLRKVAKDFESIFMAQVLKGMRETVHKEDAFHGGPGEDLFEGLLDEEISKRIAGQGSLGIGELLYRDLSRRFHIGQEDGTKEALDPTLRKFLPLPSRPGGPGGIPLPPQQGQDRLTPLGPGAKADAAAPQPPSPPNRTAEVEAQVRKLRLQGLGIDGAALKR
jgi:hypothetical protein